MKRMRALIVVGAAVVAVVAVVLPLCGCHTPVSQAHGNSGKTGVGRTGTKHWMQDQKRPNRNEIRKSSSPLPLRIAIDGEVTGSP